MNQRRLFRWTGSKKHLVGVLAPALRAQLAVTGGRCISLFYGSGALEQGAFPGEAVLAAEANPDLVALHSQLAIDPARVWRALVFLDECSRRLWNGEGAYRHVAAATPRTPLERAARFLWLSSLCWNGLWRVNSSGFFNVPPDRARLSRRWPFPGLRVFQRVAAIVRGTAFVSDWRSALAQARPGDLILADPPYAGGFVEYTAARFGEAEQEQLATALRFTSSSGGVAVAAFNSPSAAHWYGSPWSLAFVTRSGCINARGDGRGAVSEFIATLGWSPAFAMSPDTSVADEKLPAVAL